MREELLQKGALARDAAFKLACIDTELKNRALSAIADALSAHSDEIIEENKKDIAAAEEKGTRKAMIDRLTLTPERIAGRWPSCQTR